MIKPATRFRNRGQSCWNRVRECDILQTPRLLLTSSCVTLVTDENPLDFHKVCKCQSVLSNRASNPERCTGSWARRRSEPRSDIWRKNVWHTERHSCTTSTRKETNRPSSKLLHIRHSGSLPLVIVWRVEGGLGSSPAAFTVSVLVRGAAVEIHFLKGRWGKGGGGRGGTRPRFSSGWRCKRTRWWWEGEEERGSEEESMRPDSRYLAPGPGCINGGGVGVGWGAQCAQ